METPESFLPYLAAQTTYSQYVGYLVDKGLDGEKDFETLLKGKPEEDLRMIITGFVLMRLHLDMIQRGVYAESNPCHPDNARVLGVINATNTHLLEQLLASAEAAGHPDSP